MAELNIDKAEVGDLKSTHGPGTEKYFSVDPKTTDGPSDQKETRWLNTEYPQYLGYYKEIPELAAAIDAKATWTVGKGFKADEITNIILGAIKGWGRDTFNTILENCIRTYTLGGDSFCEIITNDKGILINLKPLDPATMVIVVNGAGIIIKYEQINRKSGKLINKFEPNEIFHLARNRVADEIHGVSIIPALQWIIDARNEAMADWRRVMHRNVDPMWIIQLDTDNETKVSGIKGKIDEARGKGETIYIPKDTVTMEQVTIAPNSNLNPLPWIDSLNQYFYQATGGTDIVIGVGQSITEASAKIRYLAFQQTIEEEQLYIEEEVLAQLNLIINLEFPASLENELISDKPKVEESEVRPEQAVEPNDTTAKMEGNK